MIILTEFEKNPIPEASDKDLIDRLSKTNIISDFVVNGDRKHYGDGEPTYEAVRLASSDIITKAFKADSPLDDKWRKSLEITMRHAFTTDMESTGVHAVDNTMFKIAQAYLETPFDDVKFETTVLMHLDRLKDICRDYFTKVTGMKVPTPTLESDDPDTQSNPDKHGPYINGVPEFLVDLFKIIDVVRRNVEYVERAWAKEISNEATEKQNALILQLKAADWFQQRRTSIVIQMGKLDYLRDTSDSEGMV